MQTVGCDRDQRSPGKSQPSFKVNCLYDNPQTPQERQVPSDSCTGHKPSFSDFYACVTSIINVSLTSFFCITPERRVILLRTLSFGGLYLSYMEPEFDLKFWKSFELSNFLEYWGNCKRRGWVESLVVRQKAKKQGSQRLVDLFSALLEIPSLCWMCPCSELLSFPILKACRLKKKKFTVP